MNARVALLANQINDLGWRIFSYQVSIKGLKDCIFSFRLLGDVSVLPFLSILYDFEKFEEKLLSM